MASVPTIVRVVVVMVKAINSLKVRLAAVMPLSNDSEQVLSDVVLPVQVRKAYLVDGCRCHKIAWA